MHCIQALPTPAVRHNRPPVTMKCALLPPTSSPTVPGKVSRCTPPKPVIQYASLDNGVVANSRKCTPPPPPGHLSPPRRPSGGEDGTMSYTAIDIERTAALLKIKNAVDRNYVRAASTKGPARPARPAYTGENKCT